MVQNLSRPWVTPTLAMVWSSPRPWRQCLAGADVTYVGVSFVFLCGTVNVKEADETSSLHLIESGQC